MRSYKTVIEAAKDKGYDLLVYDEGSFNYVPFNQGHFSRDGFPYARECPGSYQLHRNGNLLFSFTFARDYSCCGLCILHKMDRRTRVSQEDYNKAVSFAVQMAKIFGYGMINHTTFGNNNSMKLEAFEKAGFRVVNEFVNPRSDNRIVLHSIDIGK